MNDKPDVESEGGCHSPSCELFVWDGDAYPEIDAPPVTPTLLQACLESLNISKHTHIQLTLRMHMGMYTLIWSNPKWNASPGPNPSSIPYSPDIVLLPSSGFVYYKYMHFVCIACISGVCVCVYL